MKITVAIPLYEAARWQDRVSENIANNVNVVGRRPVQVFRAKRERVFDRWVGVNSHQAQSKLGTRLLVTGDRPPHDMFLSHNDLLHVSGLPPNVTLEDLSKFFQPFVLGDEL